MFPRRFRRKFWSLANFKIWTSISVIGIIVTTAAFFLRMVKLVLMGEFNPKWEGHMPEISTVRELVTIVPLAVMTLVLGIYPAFALRLMDTTLTQIDQARFGAILRAAEK